MFGSDGLKLSGLAMQKAMVSWPADLLKPYKMPCRFEDDSALAAWDKANYLDRVLQSIYETWRSQGDFVLQYIIMLNVVLALY
jgi:hypothetical protein